MKLVSGCVPEVERYCLKVLLDPYRTPNGGTADYVFMLLCLSSGLFCLGYALNLYALGGPLVFSLIYLWSRKNPDSPVSVWGFRFQGSNLPWVFIAFNVLTGNSPVPDLCGLAVGHVYYFLVEVLPLKYGRSFVSTPGWVVSLTEAMLGDSYTPPITRQQPRQNPREGPAGRGAAPAGAAAGPARHNWGTGRRLGG